MDTKTLVAVRKEAEKAIAEMPDGDLKLKAFEVILGHLLRASSEAVSESSTAPADERKSVVSGKGKSAKPAKGSSAKTATERILILREEGFFKSQRSMGEVASELAAHGWHYPLTALSGTLQSMTQRRDVRRVRAKRGNKKVWLYSEP